MTSLPSPPNRRRRRIVVVSTTAVLVATFVLAWWSSRFSVDKRYAGRWIDKGGTVLNLNADGHFFLSAEGDVDDFGTRWWISGDRLVFYTPRRSQLDNAHNWLKYFARRVTGQPQRDAFEESLITKFDGETLQLSGELDLKRVPKSANP